MTQRPSPDRNCIKCNGKGYYEEHLPMGTVDRVNCNCNEKTKEVLAEPDALWAQRTSYIRMLETRIVKLEQEREQLRAELATCEANNEWLRQGDYSALEEGSAEWEDRALTSEKECKHLRELIKSYGLESYEEDEEGK
jgi:hypothetical protein